MDLIFDNPLASMYGPLFLFVYGVLIVFSVIFLAVIKRLIDNTDRLPVPPISNSVDPFEISYLRGKDEELARSVIFSLMQKDFVEFSEPKTSIKRKNPDVSADRLSKIEQITLNWLGDERSTNEIFSSAGLIRQLQSYSRSYKEKLEKAQLLINDDVKQKFNIFKKFVLVSLIGLGVYKIIAAIMHGKFNILFIILLVIGSFWAIRLVSNLPRISKLGQTYLDRLQLTFANLKDGVLKDYSAANKNGVTRSATMAGVDPMLLSVGVFGGAILAGTIYSSYNSVFAKSMAQQSVAGSCGSSCGTCSSCSSSSSCSSGSSCSSCSSCGGCGGCS